MVTGSRNSSSALSRTSQALGIKRQLFGGGIGDISVGAEVVRVRVDVGTVTTQMGERPKGTCASSPAIVGIPFNQVLIVQGHVG
jgi:hypothetical protein